MFLTEVRMIVQLQQTDGDLQRVRLSRGTRRRVDQVAARAFKSFGKTTICVTFVCGKI